MEEAGQEWGRVEAGIGKEQGRSKIGAGKVQESSKAGVVHLPNFPQIADIHGS